MFFLRSEFKALLSQLKIFKAGSITAEFEKSVNNLANEENIDTNESLLNEENNPLIELAKIHPDLAIIKAWSSVEQTLYDMNQKFNNNNSFQPIHEVINTLVKNKEITKHQQNVIHDLRKLRNEAAHSSYTNFNPTFESVLNYIKLTDQIKHDIKIQIDKK